MTLPADLYELPTLAQHLAASGDAGEPAYQCPTCPRVSPPEGLADTTGLPGGLPRWVCHTCASGPFREAHQALFQLARALAGPDWTAVRSRRNGLLAASDWRAVPDNGLPAEVRDAWCAYRQQLRDLTTTYDHPDTVVWPTPPA